jgi:UDP-glucose 4-epimerase
MNAGNRYSSTLITGGAGYIGSHVVRLLAERGERVVVVDDLSSGDLGRIPDVPFALLDLAAPDATERLVDTLRAHDVGAVMHFAAKKQVGESVAEPTRYFDCNVGGLTNLLSAMETAAVDQLVFSSSAAVYGEPASSAITEDAPCAPVNPYGQSKLIGEWMTQNAAAAWGLRVANLRYFNVAGAGWSELADGNATNLVPLVIEAALAGRAPKVFGTDWDTTDGSCVRDYIHVLDLAEAHLAALDHVRRGGTETVFNLGTGSGSSVLEVIAAVSANAGRPLAIVDAGARPGDPAAVVADPGLAARALDWRASRTLDDIVRSAWDAATMSRLALAA